MSERAEAPTIFALSSGALPAAIAIVRISGSQAGAALEALSGGLPRPRRAVAVTLTDRAGELLDRALVLWLPGPATATGEDIAELHLHGGKAVVAAVLAALARLPGLRLAEPGEFTRRAFAHGQIDLAQAEGLADLLAAETETQRRQALQLAEGGLGRLVTGWRDRLLGVSARIEAAIEFGEDQDDVPQVEAAEREEIVRLAREIADAVARPPAERLRDGLRIVVAGPTNAGKSSLINALIGREMVITSPVAGTTRDIVEAPVVLDGIACILTDSAGLRTSTGRVEQIGVRRAKAAIDAADLILWLGPVRTCPDRARAIVVGAKSDLRRRRDADIAVSSVTGAGLDNLRALLVEKMRALLPPTDMIALNLRHRMRLTEVREELDHAVALADPLLIAEHLRHARLALDRTIGRTGVEDMLDALFGRFCIGK